MTARTSIPTPPRLTATGPNDHEAIHKDLMSLHEWAHDFHAATVRESKLLDPAHQADAGTFDHAALPDPTNTSIAKAQDVANRALNALLAHSLFP